MRYTRDTVANALQAMAKVSNFRMKRERIFYKQSMQGIR